MLVATQEMLLKAQAGGYAVGAFNVENMEMIQAVIAAAEELKSPVILQTTSSTLKYASPATYSGIVKALADEARVPIALHLDHGSGYEIAVKAVRAGYTSIMIDGSHGSFEENVAITQKVTELCHLCNIGVEAELGKVGGKEDETEGGDKAPHTDPLEAKAFVVATGCDSLAIAIGTAHGVYKGLPKVDLDRLSEIRKQVSIPLVLHGTSGVPDDVVQEAIKRGICKVNYATDLRIAYTRAVSEVLKENPDTFDPKTYGTKGRDYVKNYVADRIKILGSAQHS